MSSEDEEYEDEIEEYRPDNHDKPEEEPEIGCIQLMKTFTVCRGKVYVFTVGRKTVIGKVIDIRRRFMKAVVETESGKVYLDLRKVSVIQEATQED
jgi:hypothetical protein